MASKSASLLILAALVAAAACAGSATARGVPVAAKEDAVKRPETFQEGTVLIPGIGRYELGTHYRPDIGGLDHSIPAAARAQFIPGADDTWVPNPGFEVPNPFRPAATTESP
ncbi:hypothetical protein CFC21_084509 [Triticum aestivum]|uniref:Uncharacterized protein n=3 Tax=Triticum TaxID=4564 RepID=A0A9R0Y7I7_TRITD|nr:putative cell wall protein [Triticum dicoccoides]XP_044404323.1 putative cell wall protein [Triticum aestivum]XP_048535926.1 putative cell wall protein [Triticum urartu]KAF7080424.1 hypothetical protein CFC21_084509 [Triticum aestivum]VAI49464.1 unnamed protein product [Triticum turgidum subsp. durum]